MAIGGVIGWLKAHPAVQFSLIGRPADWQVMFIAAGLPGSAFALAMLGLREPPRGEDGALATGTTARSASVQEVAGFIRLHARLLVPVFLGLPILAAGQFGLNVWTPTFFIRSFGWTPAQIGPVFGIMVGVLSTSGDIAGGWLADRLFGARAGGCEFAGFDGGCIGRGAGHAGVSTRQFTDGFAGTAGTGAVF